MNSQSEKELSAGLRLLHSGNIQLLDLSHQLRRGIPQSPNHATFRMVLDRRHGDVVQADGGSMANELLTMPGHIGTHVDALGHVSYDGVIIGGASAESSQSQDGLHVGGIEEFKPYVGRAVVLNIAAVKGTSVLPAGYEITPEDLTAAERDLSVPPPQPGEAILVATGWSAHWDDPVTFVGMEYGVPGPGEASAHWLAEHSPVIVGAETLAFEHIPPGLGHSRLPGHRVLLIDHGIYIMEMVNMSEVLRRSVEELSLVVSPLNLSGATGAPCRPLGILPREATA